MYQQYQHNQAANDWAGLYGGRPPPVAVDDRMYGKEAADRHFPALSEELSIQETHEDTTRGLNSRPRYRSIAVPVDGGHFGEHALPFALAIARQTGAEVRLVHVHCPKMLVYHPSQAHFNNSLSALHRLAYLNDLVRRLEEVGSVPVIPTLLEGSNVADALCRLVSTGTDLVVMATHGRGPFGRFWFGSVADELMQQLSVPLLLVRGNSGVADLTAEPPMRNILIPLDGSEVAEQALKPALSLGRLTGARHTLLRVVPLTGNHWMGQGGMLERMIAEHRHLTARQYLQGVVRRLDDRSREIVTPQVFGGWPYAEAIVNHAESRDVDLIAVATRKRGRLSRLFRESVAARVAHGATMPVMICGPGVEEGEMAERHGQEEEPD